MGPSVIGTDVVLINHIILTEYTFTAVHTFGCEKILLLE